MTVWLALVVAVTAATGFLLSPRARDTGSFFRGRSIDGAPPGLLTLTFSQVTTWIFARSLLNAAILGYYFGIGGTLAYAAYYLSFVTGAWIIRELRFRQGYPSIHAFLSARFGAVGVGCYTIVIALRLVSEVFANLLVVGLLFGAADSMGYALSVILVGALTLGYAVRGGLLASLRTDVLQMSVFLALLIGLVAVAGLSAGFSLPAIIESSPDIASAGWVLLMVALLQVWSYPMHDPVMMDRGFIADRRVTMASFYHAAWISILCIMAFGLLGVYGGLHRAEGEELIATLTRLLGDVPMLLFSAALIVSAMSTLDSALSSAAKLGIVDMRLGGETVRNGRLAMAGFLVAGLLMVFIGSQDLFSAVAISGTASMYLAPVIFFSLWLRWSVPVWAYAASFVAAMVGAGVYFGEEAGYLQLMTPLLGLEHKYSKLLAISGTVLAVGCGAFLAAWAIRRHVAPATT
ncbi:MAG: sodium:proline symporter [Rhodospirillales bacterium]|nr:MAG: sodium:proline symporter [Rhodospirillales bacterium]